MIALKFIQTFVAVAVGAVLWIFLSVAFHEVGHVFAAKALTKDVYEVEQVQIWPSLQVYPDVEYVAPNTQPAPAGDVTLGDTYVKLIGKADAMSQMNTLRPQLGLPPDRDPQKLAQQHLGMPDASAQVVELDTSTLDETRELADQNVIRLMGSVMTGFVSLVALVCIVCFDLAGIKLFFLSVLALLHLDALLYAFLPTIFKMPNLLVVGDREPEPVAALAHFGISPIWTCTMFALLSILQLGLLFNHWRNHSQN